MAEGYAALLAEVDRIVRSPYPTTLKTLRDIVYTQCTEIDITKCMQARLCQVERLALCLLEGLRHWPYVLDIITRLSHDICIRDAILSHEPSLLPRLLDQAADHDGVHSKYTLAAVAMLARPLPDSCPLPATAQNLFIHLVDEAAETPSGDALKPVYSILQGTSTLLIGLLSKSTLSRLDEQLDSILRSNNNRSSLDAGDQLRTLHCLAIIHMVAFAAEDERIWTNSFYQTQELVASTQSESPTWSADRMRQYFTHPLKALKTVQLVVLQAMWACQANTDPFDSRLLTLKLANHLMDAIPAELRDTWCAANALIVQRLQQKALACHPSKLLQMQAFAFVCSLCKPISLQIAVVEGIRHALSVPSTLTVAFHATFDSAWSPCFRAVMDRSTAETLLRQVLDHLTTAKAPSMAESANALVRTLEQLRALMLEQPGLAEATVTVLADASFAQKLTQLLAFVRPPNVQQSNDQQDSSICPALWRHARNRVSHELSSLLLESAFHALPEQPVTYAAINSLLALHAASARNMDPCPHTQRRSKLAKATFAFVESEGIPQPPQPDWRETLQVQLAAEAESDNDRLRRLFTSACSELEARCENIEQPLRAEQAAHEALQQQHEQLQEAYGELEAQTIDRKLHYQALESQNEDNLRDIDVAREEAASLLDTANELERSLQAARREAADKLVEMQNDKSIAGLEYATGMAKKTEELESLHERFSGIDRCAREQEQELETMNSSLRIAETAKDSVQAELVRSEATLHEKAATLIALERDLNQESTERARLESVLHTLQQQLGQEKQDHERNLQHVKEHMRLNAEAANASHNEAIDRLAVQQSEEIAEFERRVADAEQQAKRLQRRCKQKDYQIAEANAMRSNLLAALGGQHLQASLPHRTRSLAKTPAEPTQMDDTPTTPSFGMGMDSQAFDGRASFASNASSTHSRNGPTPKRAKPRKSFKAPSPAKPRMSVSMRTTRQSAGARSIGKRRPLGSLSVNASPRKDGLKTPGKNAVKGGDDFDDSTFDESELVLNTPGAPMMQGIEGMLEEETEA